MEKECMDKPKSVYIIIFNGFTALSLCIVAQLLAIVHNTAPFFSLSRLGINFLVAYPVAVGVGMFFPAERFGTAFCRIFHLPQGPFWGVGMNVSINLVFTAVLSCVMTFFNVVLLGHQGTKAFFSSFLVDFFPMLLCSCVVSALVRKLSLSISEKISCYFNL